LARGRQADYALMRIRKGSTVHLLSSHGKRKVGLLKPLAKFRQLCLQLDKTTPKFFYFLLQA